MKIETNIILTGGEAIIGEMFIDGEYFCDTLEDKLRLTKVAGKTGIPRGTYRVLITYSPRFNRMLPLLVNVPGFEGVRIHSGNSSKDTEGCILVGKWDEKTPDWISNSKATFDKLFAKLEDAVKNKEEITITLNEL